jgi:NADPH:quinone reductase-like Zn-dependent oxidoreductase
VIGILSGVTADGINLVPVLQKKVRLQGINVGSRDMFEAMNKAIGYHKLRPVIDRVFPFEQSIEALTYMKEGAHFGKIGIKM